MKPNCVTTTMDLLTREGGRFVTPVAWIRINVTAGTGSVTATILQGAPA